MRLIRFIATPHCGGNRLSCSVFRYDALKYPGRKVQQFYTYITDKNKSHFTLDDGTKIILNRNSRFTYSDAYGTDQRKVNLEGEAYFEVAKNPERPFIVDMGNASIRVLGTTFSVKADKGKDQITAVLLEGSNPFRKPDTTSLTSSRPVNLHSSVQRTRLISNPQRKRKSGMERRLAKV